MTVNFSSTVDTFSLSYNHTYHTRVWSIFSMYQCEYDKLVPFLHDRNYYALTKYLTLYIIPYLFTPCLFPFTHGQTKFFTPCSLTPPPPPLSAWGLTRRCNSAGLAELRGGWPIELDKHCQGQDHISLFATSCVRMREYLNPWGCWYFLVYTSRILMVHVFCIFYLKFCTSKI